MGVPRGLGHDLGDELDVFVVLGAPAAVSRTSGGRHRQGLSVHNQSCCKVPIKKEGRGRERERETERDRERETRERERETRELLSS